MRATWPVWVVLGLLAASLLGSILLLRSVEEGQLWVRHTLEVRNHLARVGQGVLAAESGQLGYLLTRDEASLSLHRAETEGLRATLGSTMVLTADNPMQQARLRVLSGMVNDKLAQLQAAIDLASAGRGDAAHAILLTDGGRQLTERLLAQLDELDMAETSLLAGREAAEDRARTLTIVAMALALLAAGAMAVLEARRQHAALLATRAQNADLEERVRQRTLGLEQALAINRALTEEVHHRAGNGLTLVASFLSLQASELDGAAAEALDEARRRVVALASAQRRLRVDTTTGTADLVPYLQGILDDISSAIGDEVGLTYQGPDIPVIEPSGTAVSIGVIAGEMITNAVKHAFPPGLRGQVALRLALAEGRIRVDVEDDGIGMTEAGSSGLGSRVLPALAELLGGTLSRGPARDDLARPGTLCSLDIPVTPGHQAAV